MVIYPDAVGYGEFSARVRHAGSAEIGEALHAAPGHEQSIGVLRWEGVIETPRLARIDNRRKQVETFIAGLDSGNELVQITIPSDYRYQIPGRAVEDEIITVQVIDIQAGTVDRRGSESGYRLAWVEVPK